MLLTSLWIAAVLRSGDTSPGRKNASAPARIRNGSDRADSAVPPLTVHEVLGQHLNGRARKLYAGKLPPSSFEMNADASGVFAVTKYNQNSTGFMGDIRFSVSNTFEVSISLRRCMFAIGGPPEVIAPFFKISVRLSSVSIFAIIASATDAP